MKHGAVLVSVFAMAVFPATGRAAWTAPMAIPDQGASAGAAINGAGDAVVLVDVPEDAHSHDHSVDLMAMTHEPGSSWSSLVRVPFGDHVAGAQATLDSSGGLFADWARVDGRAFYSARAPGGPFGAAVELPVNNGKLASDAAGDQLLVWGDAAGPTYASFRPEGGAFGSPINLVPGHSAVPSEVAMDPRGDAVVLLDMRAGGDDVGTGEEAVYRPAGGSFGAPQTLDTKPADAINITGDALAISANGTAVALWDVLGSDGVPTLFAATKPPGGSFGARMTLQPHDPVTASDLQSVEVAIGPRGDAVASWWAVDFQPSGTDLFALRAAYQPAGGTFGGATQLTPEGEGFRQQAFAVDSSGTVIALWQRSPTLLGNWVTQAAVRPADGSFGAPVTLASGEAAVDETTPAQVAINPHDEAFLVWNEGDVPNEQVRATERLPGAAFAVPQTIGASTGPNLLSLDDAGDALVVTSSWVAGWDPEHVLLRSVTLPPSTFAGKPASFSASASDVWGAQFTWNFGDKATGTGSPVSHAYGRGGTYKVSVTAGLGPADQVSQTGTIRISNAIWKLRVSPRTLRLASRCKGKNCGSKVSYRLGLAGKVKLWIERSQIARRAHNGCGKAASRGTRCARYVRLHGTLTRKGKQGRNAFRFDDRLEGRRLKPGRYLLFAQAPTGQVVSAPFRIA